MKLSLLTLVTVLLVLCNLFFGAVSLPAREVWSALTGSSSDEVVRFIVMESRLPQAVTALLAGAALSSSGLMLQTLFRNPLAGPSVLGITSGASLGVALIMMLAGGALTTWTSSFGSSLTITAGALAGSFLVMGLLVVISSKIRGNLTLLIVGMMVGYLASSVVTLLSSLSTAQSLQGYVMWGMGTFANVGVTQLPWFSVLTLGGLLLSMLLAKPLNLLLLGDNYAANLGVNVHRVRLRLLAATGLLSAIVTACCGPVSFIGLAMPHIARLIFRTDDHLVLMPATMLCGSILALGCNVASVIPDGNIIPINALTPLAGVPVVLYVIMRGHHGNQSR